MDLHQKIIQLKKNYVNTLKYCGGILTSAPRIKAEANHSDLL